MSQQLLSVQVAALLHEYAERYRVPATAQYTSVTDYADRICALFNGASQPGARDDDDNISVGGFAVDVGWPVGAREEGTTPDELKKAFGMIGWDLGKLKLADEQAACVMETIIDKLDALYTRAAAALDARPDEWLVAVNKALTERQDVLLLAMKAGLDAGDGAVLRKAAQDFVSGTLTSPDALAARPYERITELTSMVQFLLDSYVVCEDNVFCFPNGETWDVVPAARPPQQEPSPWIDVDERLPSATQGWVIAAFNWQAQKGVAEAKYMPKRCEWINGEGDRIRAIVTHWMPLPQHPKEAGVPPLKEETTQSDRTWIKSRLREEAAKRVNWPEWVKQTRGLNPDGSVASPSDTSAGENADG